ncbi:MAG: TonB-dependent receptor, partial [Amphiplicatus sp.]
MRKSPSAYKRAALASVGVFASAFASTLGAQQAAAQAPAAAGDDEVVVTGRRVSTAGLAIGADETSNTVAVTREALLSAPSGIS